MKKKYLICAFLLILFLSILVLVLTGNSTGIDNYLIAGIISLALSIISQIGDFVASSIKRFADIKFFLK